jgi:putative ABC transport system permease protein
MMTAFTALAVFVACLGLLGMASFTAEQRTKEIGIRKTLGASVINIIVLLSKETALLVIVAAAVATPVAYFLMSDWLENFAYRITLGPLIFIAAGALALAVALTAVGLQTTKAALANPVDSLRHE